MPEIITTTGIVLSRRDWRESSRLVTFIAPDTGRLRAVARGVRKLTSGVGPALEPVTESEIVFSTSARSDLAQIRSAEVMEYFGSLRRSFIRLALASALCELVEGTLPEAEPAAEVYEHLRDALVHIEAADDGHAVNWFWRSLVLLATDIGYAVQFDSCSVCGAETDDLTGFSLAEGGPVCSECEAAGYRSWQPETLATFRWLMTASDEELTRHRLKKETNREVRRLLESYFRYHIPDFHHLRSLDILSAPEDEEQDT